MNIAINKHLTNKKSNKKGYNTMTNLKLITTETFGDLSCNFYRNMNDDILLTREQIGQALEYSDPDLMRICVAMLCNI